MSLQGEQLIERLYIPRLHVRKNWYVGLNPDPVDHSHPDIGKAEGAENPFQHAAHAAQAAHQHQPTASHAGQAQGHAAQQHPPPPPPAQQQPAHAASIPTQPLAQGQQQQQQGKVGSGAPGLPQSPAPHAAQQQQPQVQPTQQAHQQQQPAQQSPQPLKDLSAVLKVKERIENYEKQFGEVRKMAVSQQAAMDRHDSISLLSTQHVVNMSTYGTSCCLYYVISTASCDNIQKGLGAIDVASRDWLYLTPLLTCMASCCPAGSSQEGA